MVSIYVMNIILQILSPLSYHQSIVGQLPPNFTNFNLFPHTTGVGGRARIVHQKVKNLHNPYLHPHLNLLRRFTQCVKRNCKKRNKHSKHQQTTLCGCSHCRSVQISDQAHFHIYSPFSVRLAYQQHHFPPQNSTV